MFPRVKIAIAGLAAFFVCGAAGLWVATFFPVWIAEGCDHYEDWPYIPHFTLGLGALGALAAAWFTARRLSTGSAIRPSS
jgi:hypothetical protein